MKAEFEVSRGKVGSVGGAEPGRVTAGDVSSLCLIVSNLTSSSLLTPEPAADVATLSGPLCPGVIREQSPQLAGSFLCRPPVVLPPVGEFTQAAVE